jgi:hypothetical protein
MAILPDRVGFVVNGLICSAITVWLVIRQGGSWLAVLVVLLSPSSIGTQLVGNIEWVPMLGILIGGAWGTPFLLAKPQTVGLVALLFFARTGFRWRFWLPAAGVLAASLLVWGWWPAQIPTLPRTTPKWNLAIFPWGVPLAIACAWLAWKRNALRWALLAGVLLTPYLGIGSLTPVIAVWSARYPRAVGLLLVTFWLPMGIVLWSRL